MANDHKGCGPQKAGAGKAAPQSPARRKPAWTSDDACFRRKRPQSRAAREAFFWRPRRYGRQAFLNSGRAAVCFARRLSGRRAPNVR
jgi:hypothetical protein